MGKSRNNLLWRIEYKNQSSWLLGTMHLGDAMNVAQMNYLQNIINKCSCYVGESDLDDIDFQPNRIHHFLPNGKRLQDYVGMESYTRMEKIIMKSTNLKLKHFDRFLPLFTLNILTNSLLDTSHKQPLDMILWQIAKKEGIATIGLESSKEQLQLLKELTLTSQMSALKAACRNFPKFRKNTKRMVDAYKKQDIHNLNVLSRSQAGKSRLKMIIRRNERMTRRIVKHMGTQSCFFAVGAGHLSGGKGILHLLTQNGVQIYPDKAWKSI